MAPLMSPCFPPGHRPGAVSAVSAVLRVSTGLLVAASRWPAHPGSAQTRHLTLGNAACPAGADGQTRQSRSRKPSVMALTSGVATRAI